MGAPRFRPTAGIGYIMVSQSRWSRGAAFCPAAQTATLHHKSVFICTAVAATRCQVSLPAAAVGLPLAGGGNLTPSRRGRRPKVSADNILARYVSVSVFRFINMF